MKRMVVALLATLAAAPAVATPCAPGLCAADTGPCRIEASCDIAEPFAIDLGERALVIGRGVTVRVLRGPLAIAAAAATLEPGARLIAPDHLARGGGAIELTAAGGIHLQRDDTAQASIDVSGEFFGGTIALSAGEDIVLDGPLVAAATRFGFGGRVTLASSRGSVALHGAVVARADAPGFGGLVQVTAPLGTIAVEAPIDLTGGVGGQIILDANGDVTVAAGAPLDAGSAGDGSVLGAAGDGGNVRLRSRAGHVAVAAEIRAAGARVRDPMVVGGVAAGFGGNVEIDAPAGNVLLLASVDVSVPGPDGVGGGLFVFAGGDVVQRGTVLAAGLGSEGTGGIVDLSAGGSLVLGSMDLRGGYLDAGDLQAKAAGTITLDASVVIDGRGTAEGGGARVSMDADTVLLAGHLDLRSDGFGFEGGHVDVVGTTVTMTGRIDVRAQGTDVFGGSVQLDACALSVPPGAAILSNASEGLVALIAHTSLVLGGSVVAGPFGATLIRYGFLPPPVVPAGTFAPAPVLVPVSIRHPCPGAPPTTTTTRPRPTSTTVTTTTIPPSTATSTTTTSTTTTAPLSTSTTTSSTTRPAACAPDAPLACDDDDPCTSDTCVAGTCAHGTLPPFDDLHCRLESTRTVLRDAAPTAAGGARSQSRLDRRLRRARNLVDAAALGHGARAARLIRRARRELDGVLRHARRTPGIQPDLGARIVGAADDIRRRMQVLEAAVRTRAER